MTILRDRPAATANHVDHLDVAGRVDWRAPAARIHAAVAVIAVPLLLLIGRGQWFQTDEWAFITGRQVLRAPSELLLPHVGHWSSIPILIYRALYATVGLHRYAPYLALVIVLHVVTTHLLWRVMVRSGVRTWLATALAAVLLFFGPGHENILWAFQITWHLSLITGLSLLLWLDRDRRTARHDLIVAVVATIGLMTSGVMVAMVVGLTVVAWARRGWLAAVRVATLPAVVYVAWAIGVWLPSLPPERKPSLDLAGSVAFVWTSLGNAFDQALFVPGAGGVIALLLLVVLARTPLQRRRLAVFATATSALAFLGLAAISRVADHGITGGTAPRYVYIVVALLLPAIAIALDRLIGVARPTAVAVAGLLAVVLVAAASSLVTAARETATEEQQVQRELNAAASLVVEDADLIGLRPSLTQPVIMRVDHLRALVADGNLPSVGDFGPADLLAARVALQVAATAAPAGDASARPTSDEPVLDNAVGLAIAPDRDADGCLVGRTLGGGAQLVVAVPVAGSFRLDLAPAGSIGVRLREARDRGERTDPARVLELGAEGPYVTTSADDLTLELELPEHRAVTLCEVTVGPFDAPVLDSSVSARAPLPAGG